MSKDSRLTPKEIAEFFNALTNATGEDRILAGKLLYEINIDRYQPNWNDYLYSLVRHYQQHGLDFAALDALKPNNFQEITTKIIRIKATSMLYPSAPGIH